MLGSFRLLSPLGKGGMGEVWRGVHAVQKTPVAIKVVTAEKARNPQYHAAFRGEVQAAARLDHPGVVVVFDYGEVGHEAEEGSRGRLSAGGPFLAMELVDGGDLYEPGDSFTWPMLLDTFLPLLDALAHAHARGLVHRDLKPSNVLRSRNGGIKLTDFGIAHALDAHTRTLGTRTTMGSTEPAIGTPTYMAPEQFEGRWRDYGPWTDLYALGVMAYELANGCPPFVTQNVIQLALAHVNQRPHPLQTPDDYPPGFADWVLMLLEKAPGRRFRRAADAAHALLGLDGGSTASVGALRSPMASAERVDSNATTVLMSSLAEVQQPKAPLGEDPQGQVVPDRPPIPAEWRRTEPSRPVQLAGAGLGLFGLRTIPLVGREAERDAIWSALREVGETGGVRLVLLHGAAGVGKSRVLDWACQRAHELGAATPLRATHSPTQGPADGLPRMLARHLRCVGMARGEVRTRIAQHLRELGVADSYEADALTELVSPRDTDTDVDGVRLESPAQRYAVLRRYFRQLGERRAVILALDDAQWGGDAMGLATFLLSHHGSETSPILILATVRDEALAERPAEASRLAELAKHEHTRRLRVDPLSPSYHVTLVQRLLGLDTSLAKQIAERTAGNPLFAVQLVDNWVRRRVLVVSDRGFVLAPGEAGQLPDQIHEVWRARIDRFFEEMADVAAEGGAEGSPGESALELAAVLGQEVDAAEWRAACWEAQVAIPEQLAETLVRSRLAYVSPEGDLSFVHGMLRESLERRSRDGKRWVSHNAACARALKCLYPTHHAGLAERIARHLLEAEALEEALGPLLQAAQERFNRSEYRVTSELLDRRDQAVIDLWLPEGDVRAAEAWLHRAHLHFVLGPLTESLAYVERAETAARQHGWPRRLAEAQRRKGVIMLRFGRISEAVDLLEEARNRYRELDHPSSEATCMSDLAWAALLSGDYETAEAVGTAALERFDASAERDRYARGLNVLGVAAMSGGDYDRASVQYTRALEIARGLGDLNLISDICNNRGESARLQGDLALAEAWYREALEHREAVGRAVDFPDLNLAMLALLRGRYEQARQKLVQLLAQFEERGQVIEATTVHAALMPCCARVQQWDEWDDHYRAAAEFLRESDFFGLDVASAAQIAGDLALAADERGRARQAFELAVTQWRGLGRLDKVEEVRAILEAMAAFSA